MALTTIIAFAAGLAAKVRPPKDPLAPEVMRLLAESKKAATRIAQLEHTIDMLDRELLTERSLKRHWRDEARHWAAEARERREAHERQAHQQYAILAAQAEVQQAHMNVQQDGRYLQQALAQQAFQAQLNAHGLQQHGFQQLGQVAQNLLGAQNLEMPAGWTCTCIPDRASALRRR
jgi:hypothetical protein